MAIMSTRQEAVLQELGEVKQTTEQLKAEAYAKYQDECWEIEQPLRDLVREARDIGVPYRQIGMRMGTSDHVTIKNMEQDKRRSER